MLLSSNFLSTGDWMRNKRPALESVINAGVRFLHIAVLDRGEPF
jgi:hypothetical protein